MQLYQKPSAGVVPKAAQLSGVSRPAKSTDTGFSGAGGAMNVIASRNPSHLPVPLGLMVSGAAQHELSTAKQILEDQLVLKQGSLYADKAYIDAAWTEALKPWNCSLHGKSAKMMSSFLGTRSLHFSVPSVNPLSAFQLAQPLNEYPIRFFGPLPFGPVSLCPWPYCCRAHFHDFQLLICIVTLPTQRLHFVLIKAAIFHKCVKLIHRYMT